ncbi:MAG: L,D-transpeptidase family protein, partial [Polyangiaceae bacterium]
MQHHAEAAAEKGAKAEQATRIVIAKTAHTMDIFDGEKPLAHFSVAIGPGGPGVKHRQGDDVTPVGRYHVVSRSPSQFHIFMRLDYPNQDDRARFA